MGLLTVEQEELLKQVNKKGAKMITSAPLLIFTDNSII